MLSTEFLRFQAPKNIPPVKTRTGRWGPGRGSWVGWGRAQQSGQKKESSSPISRVTCSSGKATLLTGELGQDDFGKPRVVLAAQTFFPLQQPLNNWVELLSHVMKRQFLSDVFQRGFHLMFAKHTQLQMQLWLFSLEKIRVRRHWQGFGLIVSRVKWIFTLIATAGLNANWRRKDPESHRGNWHSLESCQTTWECPDGRHFPSPSRCLYFTSLWADTNFHSHMGLVGGNYFNYFPSIFLPVPITSMSHYCNCNNPGKDSGAGTGGNSGSGKRRVSRYE